MDGCEAIAALEAYREGDLDVLRSLLGDPADFPNCLEEAVIPGHEKAARALNSAAARHVDS